MKPSVFAAWDLKEYNEKEHKDIMQVVPKHEYDDLERVKNIVIANTRENFEDYKKISEKHVKAFEELVSGLEQENAVLKAKLDKAVEGLQYYIDHKSIIKEAYQTEQKQVVVVHGFINHKAKEVLNEINAITAEGLRNAKHTT